MNILITGAKGFVGKNLCAALKNIKDGKDKTRPALSVEEIYEYDFSDKFEEIVEEIKDNWSIDRGFTSQMDDEMRTALVHGWHKAVKCALLWGED